MRNSIYMGLICAFISQTTFAGNFNFQRGNLSDTDTIDVEIHKQFGNCPAQYPQTSVDCSYETMITHGLISTHIDDYSQHINLNTENTYLLNISVNKKPFSSCQSLQAFMTTHMMITINTTGCVVS